MMKNIAGLILLLGLVSCNTGEFHADSEYKVQAGEVFHAEKPAPSKPEKPNTPVGPVDPIDPVDPVDPVDPIGSGSELQACRINIDTTSVGQNVRITLISGPVSKIQADLEKEEFKRLSSDDQDFLKNALADQLNGVQILSSSSDNSIKGDKKLIIKNPDVALVGFNSVFPGINMALQVEGKEARISGNSLREGSKIIAVLKGSEKASLSLTSIQDNSEIFILAPLDSGSNVSCIRVTRIHDDIKLSSYVHAVEDGLAQGFIQATAVKTKGLINHHVLGNDNSFSLLQGTSLSNIVANLVTEGGDDIKTQIKFTSLKANNQFNVKMSGDERGLLDIKGTHAGIGSMINMDLKGKKDMGANIKLTKSDDLQVKGSIAAELNPFLNYDGKSEVSLVESVK